MSIERLADSIADRYRFVREIGVGGMATVHLAHDVRHDRDVAIKVLHPDLAAALGGERFLAEIRTTARLQHPHILPLLDSGQAGGSLFYVMPYVTGESLRQRLERERQLPVDEAVRIAREAASALDYAHRQGVVHRDIKPENILLHDGSALVADFGIALAVQSAGGQRMTQTGLSLGTPQYMSPEQAMGERTIDARSDIYSLAAVTYEMLTGEPPFTGATVQAVVAKVVSAVPQPVTMTRRNVSPAVSTAVHRGLEKLPADRFGTAAEFATALTGAAASSVTATPSPADSRRSPALRTALPWVAAALVAVAAFGAGRVLAPGTVESAPGLVVATLVPDDGDEWSGSGVHLAVSPDGRQVAIQARRGRQVGIVLRSLDSLGSRWLPGTNDAFYLFWSPDGRMLGFFSENQLRTIDLATGAIRSLCPAARPAGASWGADNVILYVPERGVGIHRVTPGGPCEKMEIHAPPEAIDARPRFLPDGRHFVATTDLGAWLGEVGGDSLTKLTDLQRMRAVVAGPDYLLFRPAGSPSGRIFAQRIDVRKRTLVGEPAQILEDVPNPGGNTMLAASYSGVLVARVRNDGEGRVLVRVGEGGVVRDTQGLDGLGRLFGEHRLSRDGRRIALGGWEIVLYDIERRTASPVARSPRNSPMQFPVWAPRDSMVAWVTGDSGRSRIEGLNLRTSKLDTLVSGMAAGRSVDLSDWSADGRYIAFQYAAGGGSQWPEAWVYDLHERQARRAFEEQGRVASPVIAPHGQLIAYSAGPLGATSIHVRSFPGPGPAIRVSPEGGQAPRWSPDGSQLFYYDDERGLMGVTLNRDASSISTPRVVVPLASLRAVAPTFGGAFIYDLAPDGRSFVGSLTRPAPVHLTLIVDWPRLLDRAQRP